MFSCCCETSKRVLICSETTPTARKPAHARPAPMPNLLVKVEAIQSVDSAVLVLVAAAGLGDSTAAGGGCGAAGAAVCGFEDDELGVGVCEDEK